MSIHLTSTDSPLVSIGKVYITIITSDLLSLSSISAFQGIILID